MHCKNCQNMDVRVMLITFLSINTVFSSNCLLENGKSGKKMFQIVRSGQVNTIDNGVVIFSIQNIRLS